MNPAIRRTILVLRVILAIVFINYGLIKVLGGQYYHGDWTISKSTVDGNSLIWAFFGYSPIYGRLTGLFELLPGIFILFRRTAWASAAALFAVSLNVTLMDYLFHFHGGAKQGALVYTILALAVVLLDYKKLRLVLASPEETREATAAIVPFRTTRPIEKSRSRFRSPAFVVGIVIVAIFVALDANYLGMALLSQGPHSPSSKAQAALVGRGLKAGNATFVRSRMQTTILGFNSTAQVYFSVQTPDGSKVVRVNEVLPNSLIGWRVTDVTEAPPAIPAPQ